MTGNTVYLDPETWDETLDAAGNIAMASYPYSVVQDVACSCMVWQGEAVFDVGRGIPYTSILGEKPSSSQLNAWYKQEAEKVEGVSACTPVTVFDETTRKTTGQLQITLTDGTTINV